METPTEKAACPHCGRTDYRWTHQFRFDRFDTTEAPFYRMEERCDYCQPLRMNAYYYSFAPTGVEAIDRILSAVAHAGKAYHHTEGWTEPTGDMGHFRGGCYAEWIQSAANDAAKAWRDKP